LESLEGVFEGRMDESPQRVSRVGRHLNLRVGGREGWDSRGVVAR